MEKTYTLKLVGPNGEEVSKRAIRIYFDDLAASGWQWQTKAEELYRDAVYREGLFEKYMKHPDRMNFWTHAHG